jgi:hypothetical protein
MGVGAAIKSTSWDDAMALRHARDAAFARVQQMVHEGVHAMRAAYERMGPAPPGNGWPDYLHDRDDHGAYVEARWRPTPRQIDWGYKTAVWFGSWRGRDRDRNGLHRWEWTLLELRGWQVMYGRESWTDLAEQLNDRAHFPTYDRSYWRRQHNHLVDVALNQAIKAGDVMLVEGL